MGPFPHCGRLRVVVSSGVVPPAPLRRLDRAAPVPGSPAAARSALLAGGTTLATILHLRSHRREAMSTGVSTRRRAALSLAKRGR